MSFTSEVRGLEEIAVRITGNTVVDIVDATDNTYDVPLLSFGETGNTTANWTISLYDGTNSYYLVAGGFCWNAKGVTALQGFTFNDLVVPKGWKLRALSSHASGNIHATGTKVRRTPIGGVPA